MLSTPPTRRARSHLGLLLGATLLVVAGCSREPAIEKMRLARLPAQYRGNSLVISADGLAYALVASGPQGEHVVSTLGTEPTYALALSIAFVPKSHRFVYWVSATNDDKKAYKFVADGKVIPTDSLLPGPVSFSTDGSRWVATVLKPSSTPAEVDAIMLMTNHQELGTYEDAAAPAISADGRHVAYLAATSHRTTLYVDGEARQTFDPPAAHCGVAAVANARKPDMPSRFALRYLADGSLLVITRDADGWGIYRDGTRVASYPVSTFDSVDEECRKSAIVAIGSIRTAERAPDVFWWERIAGDAELWRVVRNGRPVDDVICSEPWRRHPPELSADGRHLVYPCSKLLDEGAREVTLIRDGDRYGPYQDVWGMALSANGEHVAYAATDRAPERPWSIYVDGERRAQGFEGVWRPRISDDAATLAWEARVGKDGQGRGILGINDRYIGRFDDVLWGPELIAGDRVAWVIRRGRTLTRLSVPIRLGAKPRRWARVVAKPTPGVAE